MLELWSALVIGLAGSLHCIGMCGPIAIALPVGRHSRTRFVIGRLLYNSGRIVTYALIGMVCGLIGKTILLGGYQQALSILLGMFILAAIFIPKKYSSALTGNGWHSRLFGRIHRLWGKLFTRNTPSSMFIIGILNGFLPCGLVYLALAGSLASGSPLKGAAFMSLFGVGTIPVMLAMSLLGTVVGLNFKKRLRRLLPAFAVCLALLFILWGLSLGIPYVSPEISTDAQGQTTVNCCHQK